MQLIKRILVASIVLGATQVTAGEQPKVEPPKSREARAEAWTNLPDWSGTWWVDRPGILDTSTAVPAKADGTKPGDRTRPPYTPEYEKKYREVIERRKKGLPADPATFCMPVGMPRLLSQPFGVEFHITPELTWITWEFDAQVRRIYTDGRERPPLDGLFPSWTGYSIGKWEGDTLVIDTAAIKEAREIDGAPDQTIDRTGGVLSGQHHILERVRKTGPDTIEIDVTITDPVALTKPWKFKKTYRRAPPGEFTADYIFCQSPIISGKTKFPLPTTREAYYKWFFVDGPNAPHRVAKELQNQDHPEHKP